VTSSASSPSNDRKVSRSLGFVSAELTGLRFAALLAAVESTSLVETERMVYTFKLEDHRAELVQAQLTAARRSGTRGKEARDEELKAEARVKEAEARCVCNHFASSSLVVLI
jgi:hypothetical protein